MGFAAALLLVSAPLRARDYPAGYFRNPLEIPVLLAGNFGECRPNHFHSGLDIKTQGRENLPVHAAADGYVSRIKIESGGFGHALYITHPNGFTTLYAHLNELAPPLQRFLRSEQYRQEKWESDIALGPERFPVKKGALIAYSGNTGGSTAPHLHFEIRDSKSEHPLNPALFGIPFADTRPPVLHSLYVYDRSRSIYEQQPAKFPLTKKGAAYRVKGDTLLVPATAGFGISSDDYMDGSENTLSWYTAEWFLDEQPAGRIALDDVGYDETRYLHAFADYKTKEQTGTWVQCLFQLPGNRLDHIYHFPDPARGTITLTDDRAHQLRIVCTDASGNRSVSQCYIRRKATVAPRCPALAGPAAAYGAALAGLTVDLNAFTLYDSVCSTLQTAKGNGAFSGAYQVLSADVPAHLFFTVSILPDKPVPFALSGKIVMTRTEGNTKTGKAATRMQNGAYSASVRNFGVYTLEADTTAPSVSLLAGAAGGPVKLGVSESQTRVASFRATMDGAWILFEPAGGVYTCLPSQPLGAGRHTLVVRVSDENGNEREQTFAVGGAAPKGR